MWSDGEFGQEEGGGGYFPSDQGCCGAVNVKVHIMEAVVHG